MLKKLAIATAISVMALSSAMAAETKSPSSVSESMPEMTGGQDHPTMGKKSATPAKNDKAKKSAKEPSSVSESMPQMTGGQDHPTMGKKSPTPRKTAGKGGSEPSSVSESMPEMTGGQNHPTMGK